MIDFKEELKKYKPALEIDDINQDSNMGEIQDLIEILQHIAGNNKTKSSRVERE